jgi:aminopeptidase N
MKYILFLFGITVSLTPVNSQGKIDVLHYKFSIELNDKNDTIYGKAQITCRALETLKLLDLDLVQDAGDKGMQVIKATGVKPKAFAADKLTLEFQKDLKRGDTVTFSVDYKGVPADGLIISKNKFGHRTFFSDNWPDRAHHWVPCVDNPADKASVEFLVTAPEHYEVVSNGILVQEKTLSGKKKLSWWREDVPLATKIMVIGVADFAVDTAGVVNGIPVSSWVFPENKKEGFYDYSQAKDILSFFINYIGPYAYKKLANIQSKTIFGGMENAGAIFYSEGSVSGKREDEALLAHEIAHQWFGDMATEKSFTHLWLSEGFATYLAAIYLESKYGVERLEKEMIKDRNEVIAFARTSAHPVVDSLLPFMQLLNANSYQKGGWILHMLRRELGDSVFHNIIRTYYINFAGKNADTRDFQQICESVSGKNLSAFFDQWLYTGGIPKLAITWSWNGTDKTIAVKVTQLQKDNLFTFPLEILIQDEVSSMPLRRKIFITKQAETFTFPASVHPLRIKADPMVSLLFEGTVAELK